VRLAYSSRCFQFSVSQSRVTPCHCPFYSASIASRAGITIHFITLSTSRLVLILNRSSLHYIASSSLRAHPNYSSTSSRPISCTDPLDKALWLPTHRNTGIMSNIIRKYKEDARSPTSLPHILYSKVANVSKIANK
jgi:hypothetical protein